MGFYLGSRQTLGLSHDLGPTVTAREYITVLFGEIRTLSGNSEWRSDACPRTSAAWQAAEPGLAVEALASVVRQRPRDAVAHRRLGIAHLHADNLKAGVRHLETALEILRPAVDADKSLPKMLWAQLEAGLVRLTLVGAFVRLGCRETAKRLMLEGLIP